MLEKIHDSPWLGEGEIVSFHGFPFPTRSIVRLASGNLWVWSPIRLVPALRLERDPALTKEHHTEWHYIAPSKPMQNRLL